MKLKVFHKGLILVGVPLLVELLLISCLSLMLQKSDQAKQKEQSYRRYAALGSKLMASSFEVPYLLYSSIQYQSDKLRAACQKKIADSKAYGEELDELVANNPEIGANHKGRKEGALELLSLVKDVSELSKNGSLTDLLNYAPELQSRASAIKESTMTVLADEVRRGERETLEIQKEQEKLRSLISIVLFAGAVINIAVGILLARFYRKNIMERISTISKNTAALGRGQALQGELGGSDEIALLDSAFHSMHRSLLAASDRERALFNNASDVICVLNADNRFTKINPVCLHFWGYEPDELLGKELGSLLSPEDWIITEDSIVKARLSKEPVNFENCIESRSGKSVESLWSAYWSESEQSLFCIVHDISERKKVERQRKQFLSMISSDLKAPLSSISLAISHLVNVLKEELPAKAVDKLSMARKNVQRLLSLVNDLLQISEMDSGSLDINKQECNINELLQRAVQDVESIAEKQNVRLNVIPVEGGWFVDPDRIMQVLVNLLSNAVKFSPAEGVVSLSAEKQGDFILCKVVDQGRGVPEAYRKTIFEKFKQVEAADGKRKAGTGLGLPICKQIIEEHGGSIGVNSEEGKGSSFWFRVPVDESASMKLKMQSKSLQAAMLASKARAEAVSRMKSQQQNAPEQLKPRRRGSRLRLAWKGVVLIGVPIAFELVFVGALAFVLMQVDHERQIELHQRNIAFNAGKLLNELLETAVVLAYKGNERTWSGVRRAIGAANKTVEELRSLVKDDPEALEHFNRVLEAKAKIDRFLERGNKYMEGGFSSKNIDRALRDSSKLIPVAIGVTHRVQRLVDDAESKEFAGPEKQHRLRVRQIQVLVLGLAANVVASILLALFFTRDVTSRLTVLADNAGRLANEKELNPLIDGSDELAELDRAFHITAAALAEARQKERAVFDNSQDLICAIAPDGKFVSINPACLKIFGFTREEMLGKNIFELTAAEDAESCRQNLLGGFKDKSRLSFDNRIIRKDGSPVYILWSASKAEGEPTIYGIAHDITSRKELEQLKQEFLSMVSHDLRTPLTSITGACRLISEGAYGEIQSSPMEQLHSINGSGEKLLDLINDLLDIEKLESGHMQFVLESCKLQDLIQKTVAGLSEPDRVTIENSESADTEITGDRDRLVQALGNILSYALLRSPHPVQIRLLSSRVGETIEFKVIDAAPPLPENLKQQLFERFKDDGTVPLLSIEERAGTGLELPIARRIIECHKGIVDVSSGAETGNIYSVRLPLNQSAPAAAAL